MADNKKKQEEDEAFFSAWSKIKADAANAYLNRDPFDYKVSGDALYRQYKDQYTKAARMGAMDTMGQAQAMTGGYGNSYAQTVGQQAYQQQMTGLTDKIPELYSLARSVYDSEGDRLSQRYNIAAGLEADDFARWAENRSYNYQLERDRIADERYEAEEKREAEDRVLREAEIAASLGDYSRYEKLGYDTSKIVKEETEEESAPEPKLSKADETKMEDLAASENWEGLDEYILELGLSDEETVALALKWLPRWYLNQEETLPVIHTPSVGQGVKALGVKEKRLG